MSSAASSSTGILRQTSDVTAVAPLVRAAAGAQAGISARSLESESACDRMANIARTIQAKIDNETGSGESTGIDRDFNRALSVAVSTGNKRKKLCSMHAAADELVCDAGALPVCQRDARKRVYSGERPFACDQCGFRCARNDTLTVHKRIHSGERPFSCDQCEYRSASGSHLTVHKRVHTGERPFACDECEYRGARSSDLSVHKRTHSGQRPFACGECDYRCARKDTLTAHKRVHSGERPYACDQCDFRCVHRSALSRHRHIHSGKP